MSTPICTPATAHETLAAAHQSDLFQALRPPVIAAWGAGRNSTAMLIELIERGETIDVVLFADTRSERKKHTVSFRSSASGSTSTVFPRTS